ncbi:MAG: putative Fe-S oxidoreductase [Nevskia sp.]|nr:putative Fe-S oxidoreductase [Nevskia sp.]
MSAARGNDADFIDPKIQCSACEAVCCRLKVVLLPGDKVPAQFVDQDERGMAVMAKGDDGWCVAMDANSMRCTIYQQRPTICRDFAMGGAACREERISWYRTTTARR